MKTTKFLVLLSLVTSICSAGLTTDRQVTSSPKLSSGTLDTQNSLYSREDLYREREERDPFFLSGALLILAPTSPYLPDTYVPGLRIEGGVNMGRWDMELTYTYLGTSYKFDSEWVLGEDHSKRLQLDSRFALKDFEGIVAIPYKMAHGALIQALLGIEYATTRRTTQYVYKKQAMSEEYPYGVFTGVGPIVGVKLRRPLPEGFSFVGSLTQSVLRSRLNYDSYKSHKYSPVTKAKIAGEWSLGDQRGKYFHVSVGYEGQYWFNESLEFDGEEAYKLAGLGIHGAQIQATLDF